MADTEKCSHGGRCVQCEALRLAGITEEAVRSIRGMLPEELANDEAWNYGVAQHVVLGDEIAGHVFEAVTKAAGFPNFDLSPMY